MTSSGAVRTSCGASADRSRASSGSTICSAFSPPTCPRSSRRFANAPPLTRCAIHGDFNPGNVLAVHGRPVAVLDWSAARLDWAAYDLACVVGLLALERDGSIDREVADRALAAYAEAGGPGEHDALVPLLRLFLLAGALFSLTVCARGETWHRQ